MLGGVEAKHLWTPPGEDHNLCLNGEFETNIAGWTNNGPYLASGATLSRDTTQAKRGVASLKIVAGATQFHGAAYLFGTRRFEQGVPYTLDLWMRGNAGGEVVGIVFGSGSTANYNYVSGITLSAAWTRRTIIWTPNADYTDGVVAIRHDTASAQTWFVDTVKVANPATVALNRLVDDAGAAVWPRVELTSIGRSLGDAEDITDKRVGVQGEIARLSERAGLTRAYSGFVKARTVAEFRAYEDVLAAAFDDQGIGRMDVEWHPDASAFASEVPKFYEARALDCQIGDPTATLHPVTGTFVLALRSHDPRHFEAVDASVSASLVNTNTLYTAA